VDVHVADRLSRRGAHVDAEVVALTERAGDCARESLALSAWGKIHEFCVRTRTVCFVKP